MSNSSLQDIYSINLNDDIISTDAITFISKSNNSSYNTMIGDISTSLSDTISINSIGNTITTSYNDQYEIDFGDEWRTHFPDFRQVEDMCKEYPALEKALENFKTIYEMVKDDYASKTKNSAT